MYLGDALALKDRVLGPGSFPHALCNKWPLEKNVVNLDPPFATLNLVENIRPETHPLAIQMQRLQPQLRRMCMRSVYDTVAIVIMITVGGIIIGTAAAADDSAVQLLETVATQHPPKSQMYGTDDNEPFGVNFFSYGSSTTVGGGGQQRRRAARANPFLSERQGTT